MPRYTYKCQKCEHVFDVRQKFSDDPLTDCPNCQQSALRRVISNVGVVFKGSGFYVTDNRSKNGSSRNGTKSAEKSTETKSEAASDATSKDSTSTETASNSSDAAPAKAETTT